MSLPTRTQKLENAFGEQWHKFILSLGLLTSRISIRKADRRQRKHCFVPVLFSSRTTLLIIFRKLFERFGIMRRSLLHPLLS